MFVISYFYFYNTLDSSKIKIIKNTSCKKHISPPKRNVDLISNTHLMYIIFESLYYYLEIKFMIVKCNVPTIHTHTHPVQHIRTCTYQIYIHTFKPLNNLICFPISYFPLIFLLLLTYLPPIHNHDWHVWQIYHLPYIHFVNPHH